MSLKLLYLQCTKSADTAKEFNNFFASIGPKLAKKISNTEKTFHEFLASHNDENVVWGTELWWIWGSIQKFKTKQNCKL